MRVAYLHQYFVFPDQTGGTRSYDLAKSFAERGFDVEIVSATSDKKYKTNKRWTTVRRDGLVVHFTYLPYGNEMSYLKRVSVFLKFIIFASFKVLSVEADLLIATSTPLTIGIPAMLRKWLRNTPFVFEVRDVWPEAVIAIGAIRNRVARQLMFFLEKTIYNSASAIVPLSVDMKNSIVSRYPQFASKPIVVIENISELSRFQRSGSEVSLLHVCGFQPRFAVLYAGTFGRVNGLKYVIELAEMTLSLDPHLVYILLGAGAEKKDVEKMAAQKNVLNRNVFILDPASKNDLPEWYRAVDMGSSFVINIPQLWANSANKFFDTLASGKPILINHEGWQASRIRRSDIGYVLPPSLTHSDVVAFVDYTNDHQRYVQQAANAYEVARRDFSLESATNKYIQVFEKLSVSL